MKRDRIEAVYDMRAYDDLVPPPGWPPKKVGDFQWWLTALMAHIPYEWHSSAQVVFCGGKDDDGDVYVHCQVFYSRPETDEEEQRREALAHAEQAATERARQQNAHLFIAREVKQCNAEQKRVLLELLRKEFGE